MKLATLNNGSRDGRLVIVSRDLRRAADAAAIAPTMQHALEHWAALEPALRQRYEALNAGAVADAFDFDPRQAAAPLPRAYQFIDASVYQNHSDIMERAYNLTMRHTEGVPLLLQRQGDDMRGAHDDYAIVSEAEEADFEGEFAVVLDDVPMGASASEALGHIKLITIINDMSMRAHLQRELGVGFGFIQAKTATVFAPVAVTPDELGDAWRDGRVHLDLRIERNGTWFGHPNGGEMSMGFDRIVRHLAHNRILGAGTIVGSGTVSNRDYRNVGSACLAEARAIEVIDHGRARTDFLRFGDRLRLDVRDADGRSVFGAIEHRIVAGAA